MTFLIVLYWKKLLFAFFISNVNEVIRAVLSFLLFFYEKISQAQKSISSTKKHQKHKKAQKSTKRYKNAQKRNQTKAQNANEQTKIKNVLKNINNKGEKGENSNLFANLRFVLAKKKNRRASTMEVLVPLN